MQNEHAYLDLLRTIRIHGETRKDRTGVGTVGIFGTQTRYDLRQGFPLLTTKKMFWKGIVEELLWFLRGETNNRSLQAAGVHIWDGNADENGDLGPIYGKQWRNWTTFKPETIQEAGYPEDGPHDRDVFLPGPPIDQIRNLVSRLLSNPECRRHIVSAWNVADLPDMRLPPCHVLFQCYVTNDGHIDLQLYQRSADMFLGVPFNVASYSLLLAALAQITGLKPRYFIHSIGDAHIYLNHLEQVDQQLGRDPMTPPTLIISPSVTRNVFLDGDCFASDFTLAGYQSHGTIKGEMAV